ncbi:uncharacterized protein SCHCODRAFT_01293678 [Schizophyllum commune H4-8]|uniref:uncharacterized protein n=1 Tax=Schizophyllum commune (strain H4-8 / FGSC 9210) TaxID=578458 RepID=UPI0021605516|nr:uncharacterized protein SCHCODRAFT_01293678 [Schizophyllum commune H4-8]KAI5896727.1 hypothetical protein SCHCODRAFT_01293678 [Schizophyllum commune H4-8]
MIASSLITIPRPHHQHVPPPLPISIACIAARTAYRSPPSRLASRIPLAAPICQSATHEQRAASSDCMPILASIWTATTRAAVYPRRRRWRSSRSLGWQPMCGSSSLGLRQGDCPQAPSRTRHQASRARYRAFASSTSPAHLEAIALPSLLLEATAAPDAASAGTHHHALYLYICFPVSIVYFYRVRDWKCYQYLHVSAPP